MKHHMHFIGATVAWVLFAGCSNASNVDDVLASTASSTDVSTTTNALRLSEQEVADLLHMREEEKLARDVYVALADRWNLRVHENISGSEQRHMNAMLGLLERYGLEDPVGANPHGVFEDSDLQALYDQLIAEGEQSVGASLQVGCTIEDLDIVDLQRAIEVSDHEDIIAVYQNLLRGSENHLRAFTSRLEATTGEVWEPTYLDADTYQEILSAPQHHGGRGRGQGRGRGRR